MANGVSLSASDYDWVRWRGPHLNGISDEKGWNAHWPANGPKPLWKASVGIGFSSPDCRFWHITFPKAATRPATRSGRTGALIPAARHEPTSLDDLK